jgi:23S rRNA (guanosine2251-2'-O)-methyltransferase
VEGKELIFGRNPVLEYLRGAEKGSPYELYISDGAHGKIIDIIAGEAKARKIPVRYEDREFFARIGPSSHHQGVALKVPQAARERAVGMEPLLERERDRKGVLVVLDHLTDPQNVGSIIRTAEALGCGGIVMPRAHAVGVTPVVVKASAGATAHIDILAVSNVAMFIEAAKAAGFWIVGTSDKGTEPPARLRGYRPAVVVIGSEGEGMRHLTEESCDLVVRIPLRGSVSSLNASVAAGIVLHEILRED